MNNPENTNQNISSIANMMAKDNGWLARHENAEKIIDECVIDGELRSLDVAICLIAEKKYSLAERLLARLRVKYEKGGLVFYQSARAAAGLHDIEKAIFYASRAVSLAPTLFQHRSFLVRAHAVSDRTDRARDVLRNALPSHNSEAREYAKLAQFIELCDLYPPSKAKRSLDNLKLTGGYLEPRGCSDLIISAIRNGGPFSMVRLGDGEAAWHRFDAYDEGRFSELYRSNRAEFLQDWFGDDHLLESDAFLRYSQRLQNDFGSHDLIGITPTDRIELEEGYLSIRGLSTTINTYRFLNLITGNSQGKTICSNSINLSLAFETNFYQDMFATKSRFGLITSQSALAQTMRDEGINVICDYVVPGDSRNFHMNPNGKPECQYPEHVERIDQDLSTMDLRGVVFLVAAGYVGKRYLTTIRMRGGVAIDLGSLADHWMRHGIPK